MSSFALYAWLLIGCLSLFFYLNGMRGYSGFLICTMIGYTLIFEVIWPKFKNKKNAIFSIIISVIICILDVFYISHLMNTYDVFDVSFIQGFISIIPLPFVVLFINAISYLEKLRKNK
ncbi:hypothetical protein ACFL1A_01515 [Patescibacteria group bacterium]